MKSCIFLFLCSVSVISSWVSSQEIDDCLTTKTQRGKCVSIDDCPMLHTIAKSKVISESDRRDLVAHKCGNRKVCCQSPLLVTTTTTNSVDSHTSDEEEENQANKVLLLPNESYCGQESASNRIIGGHVTDMEQFKWMVALDYNLTTKKGVLCGGSLINTRYVLTAAHCVVKVKEHDITLRLGDWDLELDPDCDEQENCNPQVRIERVSRIIIYPNYKSKVNDIALLRMEQALPDDYTSHILPICMPLSPELIQNSFTNANVSVVGWGQYEDGFRSRYKMYAEVITISNQECEDELEMTGNLTEGHICAKSSTGNKQDACKGDSGGPLQIQIGGTYYLVGIVSYGIECKLTTLPSVYTRVTSYINWILENITD